MIKLNIVVLCAIILSSCSKSIKQLETPILPDQFPIERYTTHGDRIITHWWNRGPGLRADGTHYQTPGVSFITVGDDGLFTYQLDLFDLAHQMKLCDELEEAGLLSPTLKQNWVVPTKRRLIAQLSRGLS